MHCVRTVTENLYWVGANDHRLALFENIHPIPKGVSYNAYLLLDEKSVLFDTVDWSACPPAAGEPRIPAERNASGLSGHQPHGAGPRRLHRGDPAALSQGPDHLHGEGLHADAPVRLPCGRSRVHPGQRGRHLFLRRPHRHLCGSSHGPLARGHGDL